MDTKCKLLFNICTGEFRKYDDEFYHGLENMEWLEMRKGWTPYFNNIGQYIGCQCENEYRKPEGKWVKTYNELTTNTTTELRLVDGVCGDVPECEYNYHDPVHPDVCHFECMLDANLEFNDRLTPKAQEYRDKSIVGVERMMKKVEDYKTRNEK